MDSIQTGGLSSWSPGTETPTIVFDDAGSFTVTTGCAQGGGRFEVNGKNVILSAVDYELGPCGDEFANIYDAHIRSVLDDGNVEFEIRISRLNLTRGERGISAHAQ